MGRPGKSLYGLTLGENKETAICPGPAVLGFLPGQFSEIPALLQLRDDVLSQFPGLFFRVPERVALIPFVYKEQNMAHLQPLGIAHHFFIFLVIPADFLLGGNGHVTGQCVLQFQYIGRFFFTDPDLGQIIPVFLLGRKLSLERLDYFLDLFHIQTTQFLAFLEHQPVVNH
jgi:hypothetical protein